MNEYRVLVDIRGTGVEEELFYSYVGFKEAFSEYQRYVDECYTIKVMRDDKDVTEQFKELLEEGDEVHDSSFQRNEAKSGGHFK